VGISNRTFLLDQDDCLFRLTVTQLEKMLASPAQHRYPQFAGQRVRVAQVLVQLRDRKPCAIARTNFHVLAFDAKGCFDVAAYMRQEFGRAEVALSPVLDAPASDTERDTPVIEAAARFSARGGSWEPSRSLLRIIHDAALGELKCPRL
jgi:hypothetical protein